MKKVLRKCVICNKVEGMPHATINPPDLPSFRVLENPPFSHTGIDYAGPLYVHEQSSEGPTRSKAYACLFTCCSTRAVHLELTPELSASSFLLFHRFANINQ